MKKLFLLIVCIVGATLANAQSGKDKYYAYGVDFSYVKVIGATESVSQLATAFEDINELLIGEMKKYDFSRMVKEQVTIDIEPTLERLRYCDYEYIKLYRNEEFELDCNRIIAEYNLTEKEGKGILIIAKLLNKSARKGIYYAVVFDIESREILYCKEVTGKARGFGLRNFWAHSVYQVIKSTKVKL